jgi:non-heme chloroperoxidase
MKTTFRQIQLPGRVRLEFAEQGERGGLPFIALQRVNDSWRSFEPVLPYLPPDLPATRCTGKNRSASH